MSEYQKWTSEILVPKEWPVDITGNLILKLARQMISYHRLRVKISLTISDVSTLVIDNENGPGYIFKKIKEIHEDTGRVDLITPVKTEMLIAGPDILASTGSNWSATITMTVRPDHPISRMLVQNSNRHIVLIAAPSLEQILELRGITGPEKYDYALRITYITNNKLYNDVLLQKISSPSQSGHPSIFIEHIDKDKWSIVYQERLSQHQ